MSKLYLSAENRDSKLSNGTIYRCIGPPQTFTGLKEYIDDVILYLVQDPQSLRTIFVLFCK